jgi:hypothetical protein
LPKNKEEKRNKGKSKKEGKKKGKKLVNRTVVVEVL